MPAFLSIFEQPQPSQAHISIEKALSASEGSERSVKSEIKTKSPKNSLSEQNQTKKRFVEPPKKSSRMGTLRRLTKRYSKKCKNDNLLHLLNWKNYSWNRKIGLNGEIFDTKLSNHVLPSGEKCENYLLDVVDKNFPESIHDNFTNSIFEFTYNSELQNFKITPKLNRDVLTEGNVVQMWKLLDKKGSIWHVSCIIWHNDEPYSFGFDMASRDEGNNVGNLALKSPNSYLEVALLRQKNKNPTLDSKERYIELLATGVLDQHMIKQLTKLLKNKTNRYDALEVDAIFPGFEDINSDTKSIYKKHRSELVEAREKWIKHITEKGIELQNKKLGKKTTKISRNDISDYSYNATIVLPIYIDMFNKKPFQLSFTEIMMTFKDFKYCRKDPGRKSIKKNCMGGLDSIFQDLFSCRLFGTYIHPKLCGPKKKCFSVNDTDTTVSVSQLESNDLFSTTRQPNTTHLAPIPNTVVEILQNKQTKKRHQTAVLGKKKKKRTRKHKSK